MNLSKKLVLGALTTGILVSPLAGNQNQASASEQPQTLKQNVTEEAQANEQQQSVQTQSLTQNGYYAQMFINSALSLANYSENVKNVTPDTTFKELRIVSEAEREDFVRVLSRITRVEIDPDDIHGNVGELGELLSEKYGISLNK